MVAITFLVSPFVFLSSHNDLSVEEDLSCDRVSLPWASLV